jgi:short-subunit dehydrogenase/acyl carrier protein
MVAAPAARPAEDSAILTAAARLFTLGIDVDWTPLFGPGLARWVDLPTYAFQRQRYWPDAAGAGREVAPAGADGAEAGFWAAVESADVDALAAAVGADEQVRSSLRAMADVLPALSRWRHQRREQAVLEGWRYRVTWQPVPDPEPVPLAGRWLLVIPAGRAGTGLPGVCERALADGGVEVVTGEADLAGLDREMLAQRLGEAGRVTGVVSLLALTGHGEDGALAGTLLLVQALGDAGIEARLWTLTSGAVAIAIGESPDPVQAAVWGLGRVAALELPQRWGGLIDVPAAGLVGRNAARFRAILADGHGEDQAAIRDAGIVARRLVRVPAGVRQESWRPRGTALITGGTGALGGHVARWAAENGAGHVVLTSRRGLAAPGAAELAAQVTELGAAVTITACDVSERAAVAGLLARLAVVGQPVTAVIHTAGVLDDGVLDGLTPGRLAVVLNPKAGAAEHLDELTAEQPLDAFIMFSSISGTIGGPGQGNYAAANAYLDALAERRRAHGLAATSVAWGAWAGSGMASDGVAEDRARRSGVLPMPPEHAVAALGQVAAGDDPAVAVADVDWQRFAPAFTSVRPSPVLSGVPEARRAVEAAARSEKSDGEGRDLLAERLAVLSAAEQEQVLLDLVRAEAAAVLGYPSPDSIAPAAAFRDLGFDSLTAVELRNRLGVTAGIQLSATLVFDYPTSVVLAEYLRGVITHDRAATGLPVFTELDRLESMISTVSTEELTRVSARLEAILAKSRSAEDTANNDSVDPDLKQATADEIFNLIDNEFGNQ